MLWNGWSWRFSLPIMKSSLKASLAFKFFNLAIDQPYLSWRCSYDDFAMLPRCRPVVAMLALFSFVKVWFGHRRGLHSVQHVELPSEKILFVHSTDPVCPGVLLPCISSTITENVRAPTRKDKNTHFSGLPLWQFHPSVFEDGAIVWPQQLDVVLYQSIEFYSQDSVNFNMILLYFRGSDTVLGQCD